GVQAFGRPRGQTCRDPAAARVDRDGLARRGDRPQQHARRLPGETSQEARQASHRGQDKNSARRRLQARMSRFSLRTRLTILVTVAAAISLAVITAGFNLLLRSNLDADANQVLQARASAALEGISVQPGSVSVKESPDRAAPDTQVWVYSGHAAVERPPGAASVQRLADSLAGGPGAHAEDSTSDIRLY